MNNRLRPASLTPFARLAYFAMIAFSVGYSSHKTIGNETKMQIESTSFGKTVEGAPVTKFTLTNANGNSVEMIDYGAIITSIQVPDRNGKRINVTAGFPSIVGYLGKHPYFGATVGRFCNRIAKGAFSMDGKVYTLAVNNGPNHLHGGLVGFDKQMWRASQINADKHVGLKFELTSPDGQEGYPGKLQVVAEYLWDNEDRLTIRFNAMTDKATHVNLTNHAYFNLSGAGSGTVYQHQLSLASDQYLEVDSTMIPTGKLPAVKSSPMDFNSPHPIGDKIQELKETNGYDHCYVVRGEAGKLRLAASVSDPTSGRTMEVHTTQPGIQLYTGNFLDGTEANADFKRHEAFCLETQHFPDAPNHKEFLTTLLQPNQTLIETTTYRFGVAK